MKISFRRSAACLGLFFALALAVSAQTPAGADDSGDYASPRWSGGYGDKNDRVQIFGSNQIAAGERVRGDAVAVMGGNLVEGAVSHDVVAVMGSNTIEGVVGHDAVAVMGHAVINGTVGHNVVAVMGSVILGPHAVVRGDVVSVGGSIERSPGAIIRGRTVSRSYRTGPRFWNSPPDAWNWRPDGSWRQDRPGIDWRHALTRYHQWTWIFVLVSLVFYALLALIFPRAIRHCGDTLAQRPGVAILTTFLALLALPPLFILLCVTIVGIPFAVGGVVAAVLFGKAALYALIGRNLTGDRWPPALAVLVGGLLCGLLYLIPLVGLVFSFFLSTLGFGCVIATLLFAAKPAVARVIAPPPASPPAPTPPAPESAPAASATPAAVSGAPAGETPANPPPLTAPPAAAAMPPLAPAALPPLAATLPRAGFWIRLGALFIDALIVGLGLKLLFLPALFLFPVFLFWSPRFLMLAAYGALMWKFKGTTIGGMICGLHVVRLDGRPIEWDTAIVRALGCLLSTAVFFLGFIWIAFDGEKQAWHDKIAGTVVVRAKGIPLV